MKKDDLLRDTTYYIWDGEDRLKMSISKACPPTRNLIFGVILHLRKAPSACLADLLERLTYLAAQASKTVSGGNALQSSRMLASSAETRRSRAVEGDLWTAAPVRTPI